MTEVVFPVGLEEGSDGAVLVHALTLPGCVAGGATREAAIEAFPGMLGRWLHTLEALGEPVPPPESELEIAVDEWVESDARVGDGESTVCFEHDLLPLGEAEIALALRRLGDLRGALLARVRRMPEAEMDALGGSPGLRRTLDELARAQWWTLSRLGASPLAEVPERVVGRLDTAMALVVQSFSELPAEARERALELDGELWTPRKVVRRLLWLEWSLGGAALAMLTPIQPQTA